MKNYGTYTDCEGVEQKIDKYHMHELLDRTHVIHDMFNSAVAEHPAAKLFEKEIEEINRRLGSLYQNIDASY